MSRAEVPGSSNRSSKPWMRSPAMSCRQSRSLDARRADQAFRHRRVSHLPRRREEAEGAQAASDYGLRYDAGAVPGRSGDCHTTTRWSLRAIGRGGRKWQRRPASAASLLQLPMRRPGREGARPRRPEVALALPAPSFGVGSSVGQPHRQLLERLPVVLAQRLEWPPSHPMLASVAIRSRTTERVSRFARAGPRSLVVVRSHPVAAEAIPRQPVPTDLPG